jgi:hypothetical protein
MPYIQKYARIWQLIIRNGKRHPIPLFKGLELKNLLIIGRVRFKVLRDYVRKSLFYYKKRKPRKKQVLIVKQPIKNKHKLDLSVNRQSYESSKIWNTRESTWWEWQRAREWFDELNESYKT